MEKAAILSITLALMIIGGGNSVIAESIPSLEEKRAEPSSFDIYMRQMKQLRNEDSQEKNVFQSNRSAELKKFERTLLQNQTCTLGKKCKLLSSLISSNVYERSAFVLQENKQIYRQLMDEQIIPIWTGTNWIDGVALVFNGFPLPEKIQKQLRELNYWEQCFGIHSVPERKNEPFSGRNIGKINGLRLAIINAGFSIKYDTTFNIWRITDTNTPTAHIQ